MDQKISALTNYTTPLAADVLPIVNTAGSITDKVTMANLMNVRSDLFMVKDATDNTKQVAFNASGLTTGTVRTLTVPDASDTITLNTTAQTLTNKTIGTGTKINTSGSDATGNIYYRDGSGNLAPMATPSDGSIVSFSGGVPVGIPNPAASNASTTVNGVSQIATAADLTAGTGAGTTGALVVVPASLVGSPAANHLVQYNSSGQLPAVDGSQLTNLPVASSANGTGNFGGTTASGTITIAHGLGRIPKKVRVSAMQGHDNGGTLHELYQSWGVYNGTTNSCVFSTIETQSSGGGTTGSNNTNIVVIQNSAGTASQKATCTVDATNIYLAFTYTATLSTDSINYMWEAQ